MFVCFNGQVAKYRRLTNQILLLKNKLFVINSPIYQRFISTHFHIYTIQEDIQKNINNFMTCLVNMSLNDNKVIVLVLLPYICHCVCI